MTRYFIRLYSARAALVANRTKNQTEKLADERARWLNKF